ncbi:unnamed protein product [Cutaneotrichosporon oleaginosum]
MSSDAQAIAQAIAPTNASMADDLVYPRSRLSSRPDLASCSRSSLSSPPLHSAAASSQQPVQLSQPAAAHSPPPHTSHPQLNCSHSSQHLPLWPSTPCQHPCHPLPIPLPIPPGAPGVVALGQVPRPTTPRG